MRIFFGFIIVIVLATGGSYLYWKKQARKVELAFNNMVEDINERSQKSYGAPFVTYDTITVGGFPTRMIFSVHNPVFNVHAGSALDAKRPVSDWIEQHRFDGTLSVGTDWQGNSFYLWMDGSRESITTLGGKQRFERTATVEKPFYCTLDLQSTQSATSSKPYQSINNFSGKLTDIRKLQCSVSGYHLGQKDNPNGLYYHMDAASIVWEFEPDGDNTQANLTLYLDNVQAGQLVEPYLAALSPFLNRLGVAQGIEALPKHFFSRLGSNTLTLRAHYSGPRQRIGFDTPFELALDEFRVENSMLQGNATFRVANSQKDDQTSELSVSAENTATFTSLYDSLYQEHLITQLIEQRPILRLLGMSIDLRLLTNEQIRQLGSELLPSLANISPLRFSLSASGALDKNFKGPLSSPAKATLDALTLQTKNWQVSAKGATSTTPSTLKKPSVQLNASCQQCDNLLSQLEKLVRTFDKWRLVATPGSQPVVSKAFLADLYRFVDALSAGRTESLSAHTSTFNTLEFKAEFTNLVPLVNGLSLRQISTMLDEFVAPHIANATTSYEPYPARDSYYQPGMMYPQQPAGWQ